MGPKFIQAKSLLDDRSFLIATDTIRNVAEMVSRKRGRCLIAEVEGGGQFELPGNMAYLHDFAILFTDVVAAAPGLEAAILLGEPWDSRPASIKVAYFPIIGWRTSGQGDADPVFSVDPCPDDSTWLLTPMTRGQWHEVESGEVFDSLEAACERALSHFQERWDKHQEQLEASVVSPPKA